MIYCFLKKSGFFAFLVEEIYSKLCILGTGNQPGPQLNTKLLRQSSLANPATNSYYWPNNITMMTMGGHNLSALHTQQPPSPNYAQENFSPTTTTPTSKTATYNGPIHTMTNIPPPITPSLLKNNFTFPSAYPMNAFNENVLVRYCTSNGTIENGGDGEYIDDVTHGRQNSTTMEEGDELSINKNIADGDTEHQNVRKMNEYCEINDSNSDNDGGKARSNKDIELRPMISNHRIIITGPDGGNDDVFDENGEEEEEEEEENDNELCLIGNTRKGSDTYQASNEGTHLLLSS